MKHVYYGYEQFLNDIRKLSGPARKFAPEAIVAVARGGVCAGQFMASALGKRDLFTINSVHYEGDQKRDDIRVHHYPDLSGYARVLIVDDIIDSGDTMGVITHELRQRYPDSVFRVAALFQKKSASIKADMWVNEAKEWVDFFWEVDPAG